MSSVTKCSSSLKQKWIWLAVSVFIIYHVLCCYGYSCGVLSAIHWDLGCIHTRGSDPCLSTIDPHSPVHFTSVTALYIFIISIIVIFVLGYTHTESCLLLIYPCFFITLTCQYLLHTKSSTDIFAYHNIYKWYRKSSIDLQFISSPTYILSYRHSKQ